MNNKQNLALHIAEKGHNLLLLGSAGTGKSFVVKEIFKRLKANNKHVQITCSTGIACQVYGYTNPKTCTIHHYLGLGDGRHTSEEIVHVIKNNRHYEHVLKNLSLTDTLIVDECSMISSKIFDMIVAVCNIKTQTSIQLIFVGDFYQLPPVPNREYDDEGEFCFKSPNFQKIFPHSVVLTEIVRQKEEALISLIQEMNFGQLTEESEKYLEQLQRPLNHHFSDSLKLFSKNNFVQDFNRGCILSLPGEMYEFISTDTIYDRTGDFISISAPRILWLKKGCPVTLIKSLSETLVNGLRGTVDSIHEDGPVVTFNNPNIITKIPKVKFSVFSRKLNTDIAVREQYPLKLAFGLTIHKAQGMTSDSVEVDCREIFKAGQLAVAISRVTSSAGLRVINYHPRYVIPPDSSVTDFMKDLSQPLLQDLTCCAKRDTDSKSTEENFLQVIENEEGIDTYPNESPESELDILDTLDDDFNNILHIIVTNEEQSLTFQSEVIGRWTENEKTINRKT